MLEIGRMSGQKRAATVLLSRLTQATVRCCSPQPQGALHSLQGPVSQPKFEQGCVLLSMTRAVFSTPHRDGSTGRPWCWHHTSRVCRLPSHFPAERLQGPASQCGTLSSHACVWHEAMRSSAMPKSLTHTSSGDDVCIVRDTQTMDLISQPPPHAAEQGAGSSTCTEKRVPEMRGNVGTVSMICAALIPGVAVGVLDGGGWFFGQVGSPLGCGGTWG
jgi:hypothetical protein